MDRVSVSFIQIFLCFFSMNASAFDLFGSASTSPERIEFSSELIGSSITKFKCPNGTEEKANPDLKMRGHQVYWKNKYCAGVVNDKKIEIEVKSVGGDLIGIASTTIGPNKLTTCDSYIESKIPFERNFFKNSTVNSATEAYVGFIDKQSKGVKQNIVFSCKSNKIIWVTVALPLNLEFQQWGGMTKIPLHVYPLMALFYLSEANRSAANGAIGITSILGLYSKDLDAGFSKAAVDKIRKSILTNDNPSSMLQIFNDAVDATSDMNRARQFLKAQGLK